MNDQEKIQFAEKWLQDRKKSGSQLAITYLNLLQNSIVPLRNSYLLTLFSLIEGSNSIAQAVKNSEIRDKIINRN